MLAAQDALPTTSPVRVMKTDVSFAGHPQSRAVWIVTLLFAFAQPISRAAEDLEMPPLDRYPAFTPAESDRLRTWIDAGAPWSATDSAKPKATAWLDAASVAHIGGDPRSPSLPVFSE